MQTPENNNEPSIHDVLEEQTEIKAPSQEQPKIWDFTDAEVVEEAEEEKTTQPDTEDKKQKPGKITDKAKQASARTAVGMLNLLQKGIFTPIISYKYKKKFTDEEITRLDEGQLIDKKKDELQPEDLALRNKWDRLMKKCERKLEEIPLDETEKKDLEEAFFAYFDYKEKTLPPEWFVAFACINAIGKRAVDVFTE